MFDDCAQIVRAMNELGVTGTCELQEIDDQGELKCGEVEDTFYEFNYDSFFSASNVSS